ncbi:hypothetical protein HYN48_12780 [Flavobacterium magnum]|uniref:DM13 domain-containing protein n=1 Tax=Flavobacterium magnum TaxID=2162713 RepID=A0A2S0RJJ0_9FLAO|nr:DM13 domain-containing protein [Flavobacterium magnum]AWA30882.1 hypothetical protein HYN48_12780 [Flavobacterium magnum]
MKTIFLSLAMVLALFSCQSEGPLTRTDVGSAEIPTTSQRLHTGYFTATSGIEVSGTANVYAEGSTRHLSLEDFSVSAGPDLKVYLATSAEPELFVNLGALGDGINHNYPIPEGVDLNTYNYVLIHCQQYNHLFAIAPLTPSE